jgi:2-keto-4-pentenoate hydratase/2-oxohepta-3-ene-1,7-dioic acid hydratase in catechol pathway
MRREDHFEFRFPYLKPGQNDFQYINEHTTYPARYKGADTFGPMGPWIVTKDEIADPHNLTVRCWLDDEIIMDDSTRNMRFSVSEVIYWIAAHSTLRAGDIISMGTAVSTDQNTRPISYGNMNRFGRTCRVEIQGLGTLVNPIVRSEMTDPRLHFVR